MASARDTLDGQSSEHVQDPESLQPMGEDETTAEGDAEKDRRERRQPLAVEASSVETVAERVACVETGAAPLRRLKAWLSGNPRSPRVCVISLLFICLAMLLWKFMPGLHGPPCQGDGRQLAEQKKPCGVDAEKKQGGQEAAERLDEAEANGQFAVGDVVWYVAPLRANEANRKPHLLPLSYKVERERSDGKYDLMKTGIHEGELRKGVQASKLRKGVQVSTLLQVAEHLGIKISKGSAQNAIQRFSEPVPALKQAIWTDVRANLDTQDPRYRIYKQLDALLKWVGTGHENEALELIWQYSLKDLQEAQRLVAEFEKHGQDDGQNDFELTPEEAVQLLSEYPKGTTPQDIVKAEQVINGLATKHNLDATPEETLNFMYKYSPEVTVEDLICMWSFKMRKEQEEQIRRAERLRASTEKAAVDLDVVQERSEEDEDEKQDAALSIVEKTEPQHTFTAKVSVPKDQDWKLATSLQPRKPATKSPSPPRTPGTRLQSHFKNLSRMSITEKKDREAMFSLTQRLVKSSS